MLQKYRKAADQIIVPLRASKGVARDGVLAGSALMAAVISAQADAGISDVTFAPAVDEIAEANRAMAKAMSHYAKAQESLIAVRVKLGLPETAFGDWWECSGFSAREAVAQDSLKLVA